MALTLARLRKLLHYDPETGDFTWITKTSIRTSVGAKAGHVYPNGCGRHYLHISIDYAKFANHRLAWFYMTGKWPPSEIDHIDGNGMNNRWSNLRLATSGQNRCNAKLRKDNTIGVKGVWFDKSRNKFCVEVNGKYFGRFATLAEAKIARERAACISHGEFYREQ